MMPTIMDTLLEFINNFNKINNKNKNRGKVISLIYSYRVVL